MKSHLRWDCFAWFTMQTISVPPAFITSCNSFFPVFSEVQTQGIVVNLLYWWDIFSVILFPTNLHVCLGVLEAGLSFFLSSLRAHERDCTRVCTYMCANMRASIKDGASWQDVTHLATQKTPSNSYIPKQASFTSWISCFFVSSFWPLESVQNTVLGPNIIQTQQGATPFVFHGMKNKALGHGFTMLTDLWMAYRCAGCCRYSVIEAFGLCDRPSIVQWGSVLYRLRFRLLF